MKTKAFFCAAALAALSTQAGQIFEYIQPPGGGGAYDPTWYIETSDEFGDLLHRTAILPAQHSFFTQADLPGTWEDITDGLRGYIVVVNSVAGNGGLEPEIFFGDPNANPPDLINSNLGYIEASFDASHNLYLRGFTGTPPVPDAGATAGLLGLGVASLGLLRRRH